MTMPIDRRGFLGLAAAGLALAPALADDAPPPIIDTHQHLWDLSKFKLPWLSGNPKLDRSFVMDDYREAVAGLGVVQSVYMEVDVEPSQQVAEAEYVLDICRKGGTPMAGAVASGRPASDGFAAYLDRFKNEKALKGVRQVLHGAGTPPGTCLAPAFVAGMKALGDRGLSFDLCMRAKELPDAATLLNLCPETSFILDHCGNPGVRDTPDDREAWKLNIDRIAKRPNVACKVSGIVASAAPGPWTADDLAPIVNHVLDAFGPDRVVFGGDWPVCTLAASYRQWVEALRAIVKERPREHQVKLFHDNARRVYRLA